MEIDQFTLAFSRILDEVEKAIVGKRTFLEKVLCAFLAEGHVLIEDFPGLAKTLTARCFASALGLSFKRIQFTPDLLPADITGGYILNRRTGSFELVKGPLFASIILADEVNRAPPKTQAAMLEAMEEGQVTLEGETHSLPRPFFVMATQNPIEYEGTFPLPEAQLDRFIVRLSIGYPNATEELEILERRRKRAGDQESLSAVTDSSEIQHLKRIIEGVVVDEDVERYMVSLVHATRTAGQLAVGASPRASLAFLKLSRIRAAMQGRMFVLPDDVKYIASDVLVHRLMLKPDMWGTGHSARSVTDAILSTVEVPKVNVS